MTNDRPTFSDHVPPWSLLLPFRSRRNVHIGVSVDSVSLPPIPAAPCPPLLDTLLSSLWLFAVYPSLALLVVQYYATPSLSTPLLCLTILLIAQFTVRTSSTLSAFVGIVATTASVCR